MAKDFYFNLMGEVIGPVTGVELRQKALDGDVTPDTFLRIGAEGEWVSASRLKSLFDAPERPSPPEKTDGNTQEEVAHWKNVLQEVEDGPTPDKIFGPSDNAFVESPQVVGRTKEVDAYPMLRGYASFCVGIGFVGLGLTVLLLFLAIASKEPQAWDIIVGGLFVLSMSSIGSMVSGQAIYAFVDLVQDGRRTKETLKVIASHQERIAQHLERLVHK